MSSAGRAATERQMFPAEHVESGTVRFVYFDLGNILVSFDRNRVCVAVADLFGGSTSRADEVLHRGGLQEDLEWGRIDELEFSRRLHDRFLIDQTATRPDVPLEKIRRAISDMFAPIEAMAGVVRQVRELGLPIGILSNTCQAHWDWVLAQQWDVTAGPFDVAVLSYQSKSMKPDATIYQHAEQHARRIAGATPEQILFVDDRPENVEAARRRGWISEVCLGTDQVVEAFQRHGLSIDPIDNPAADPVGNPAGEPVNCKADPIPGNRSDEPNADDTDKVNTDRVDAAERNVR